MNLPKEPTPASMAEILMYTTGAGFCFLRYIRNFDIEIVNPREVLDYIKKTPKKKMILELENVIKKIELYEELLNKAPMPVNISSSLDTK